MSDTTTALTPEQLRARPLITGEEYRATTGVSDAAYWRAVREGTVATTKVGGRRLVLTAPLVKAWGLDEAPSDDAHTLAAAR